MALQQQQQSLQQQRQQLTSQLQQQEEQHKHDIAALQEELHEQHTRSSTEALKCISDNALKQLASLSLGDTALYYMPEKGEMIMACITSAWLQEKNDTSYIRNSNWYSHLTWINSVGFLLWQTQHSLPWQLWRTPQIKVSHIYTL